MIRLLLPLLALAVSARAAERPPNLIFLLADDLGYGQLGSYGQRLIATPHLDRVAREGMRFTQFYAGSTVCAPSRSVLMTGLHTGHTRVRGNAGKADRSRQELRAGDVTVAEVLQKAGYATALIGKWGLGHEGSDGAPNKKGFDYFYGFLDQVHAHNAYSHFILRNGDRAPLRNRTVPGSAGAAGDDSGAGIAEQPLDFIPDLMTAEALAWVEKNKARPFFLYWSLITPHANNEGTKHGRGQEVPDLGAYADQPWPAPDKAHAATIARLDADVGRLLTRLEQLGLDRDTLLVFSSDNGHHKEGGHDPERFDANGPLRGNKRALHEGGIRVPTLARWPGHIAPGQEIRTPLWFADILPTFAELAGAPVPAGLDGRSFAGPLRGARSAWPERPVLYWEFHEGGFSQAVLLDGRWKAIRLKSRRAPIELYDLHADLGEEKDLAAAEPAVVERVRVAFEKERTDSPEWPIK